LLVTSKKVGLDVNIDETKYMMMSRDQNVGLSHNKHIIIVPLRVWKSSNICEQLKQIKNLLRNKLRAS
jgi:hypothetical protein